MRIFFTLLLFIFPSILTSNSHTKHNLPWYPSLAAFEHYNSGRSHLFPEAKFKGSFTGNNRVETLSSLAIYPSGYNMAYLDSKNAFIYGGGYGDEPGSIGAFVAKIDPHTLKPIWYNQLIDTNLNEEWDYPGSMGILKNGFIYVIYGYRLSKIDPKTGTILQTLELPTGEGSKSNTAYNGFNATSDGVLVMKSLYREAGCSLQGPDALLDCPDPTDVPPSILVSVDPDSMALIDVITLPAPVAARPTIAIHNERTYVYLVEASTVIRYRIKKGKFIFDPKWNPGTIVLEGQTTATSFVVLDDWIVGQVNTLPSATALSVIAISQSNPLKHFTIQPFLDDPIPPLVAEAFSTAAKGDPAVSWAPASVSVDPDNHLIFASDSLPGKIAAIKLTSSGLKIVWKANQTTTEFTALIGSKHKRVLVGTDIPGPEIPGNNMNDYAVWRNAKTGKELARSPLLPAMTQGTMIQPFYSGEMFYEGQLGQLIKLKPQPISCHSNH
ncbi:MAG: hypothetical protein Q8K60_00625 [Parachlamydiaceae bacterium]|nr:hypothetical protein [Parachlamydiaceae bacterium]